MILIAILLPGVSFLMRGKIIQGIIALILQVVAIFTLVFFGLGFIIWLALVIWAITSINNSKADKRTKKIIESMKAKQ